MRFLISTKRSLWISSMSRPTEAYNCKTKCIICKKCFLHYGNTVSFIEILNIFCKQILRCMNPLETSSASACIKSYSRSEEHTSELQSRPHLVCRLLLEKKK